MEGKGGCGRERERQREMGGAGMFSLQSTN